MRKTFTIRTADGGTREALQLATFARDICGKKSRFVVTRDGLAPLAVTHRASGLHVCDVTPLAMAACRFDHVLAAEMCLNKLIEVVGETRLEAALTRAEGARA